MILMRNCCSGSALGRFAFGDAALTDSHRVIAAQAQAAYTKAYNDAVRLSQQIAQANALAVRIQQLAAAGQPYAQLLPKYPDAPKAGALSGYLSRQSRHRSFGYWDHTNCPPEPDNNCYCTQNYSDPAVIQKCGSCQHTLFGNCLDPPPWTEVGAAMRGIPKAHGDISTGAHLLGSGLSEIPTPDDLKPVNLMRIALTDPIKMGAIMVASGIVPGLPLYVGLFTTPIGFALAIADAGGWDQLWNSKTPQGGTFKDAVAQSLGQGVEFFVGWWIGGGLIASAIKAALETFARNATDPATRHFVTAIADASGDIALAIKTPNRFTSPDFYHSIGSLLKKAGAAALADGDQNTAVALSGIGDVLLTVIDPIFIYINGAGTLDQRRIAVKDAIAEAVLGVKWTVLQRVAPEQRAKIVTVDAPTMLIFLGAEKPLVQFTNWMANFSNDLNKLAQDVSNALKSIGIKASLEQFNFYKYVQVIIAALGDFKDVVNELKAEIDAMLASATPPPVVGAAGAGAAATHVGAAGTGKSNFALVLAGAAAGFFIGGPVGAAAGGAGGYLVGKLGKGKSSQRATMPTGIMVPGKIAVPRK